MGCMTGNWFPVGAEISLLHSFQIGSGRPTLPPVLCLTRFLSPLVSSRSVRLTNRTRLVLRLRMSGTKPPTSLHDTVASCIIKHKDNFASWVHIVWQCSLIDPYRRFRRIYCLYFYLQSCLDLKKIHGLRPRANYTNRETAACRRR
jgi:hypothetical protein